MKAVYHPTSNHREEVEILDIFIDADSQPRMMFLRADGHIGTAPIGRFTELRNGTPPLKRPGRMTKNTDETSDPTGQT